MKFQIRILNIVTFHDGILDPSDACVEKERGYTQGPRNDRFHIVSKCDGLWAMVMTSEGRCVINYPTNVLNKCVRSLTCNLLQDQ